MKLIFLFLALMGLYAYVQAGPLTHITKAPAAPKDQPKGPNVILDDSEDEFEDASDEEFDDEFDEEFDDFPASNSKTSEATKIPKESGSVKVEPKTPAKVEPKTPVKVEPKTPVKVESKTPAKVEPKTPVKVEPKSESKIESKQSADKAQVEPPKLPTNKYSVPEMYVDEDEDEEDEGPVDMDLDESYEAEEVEPNVFSSHAQQLANYANQAGYQIYHDQHNAVQVDHNQLAAYYNYLLSQGMHHDHIMQMINHEYQQHLANQQYQQQPAVAHQQSQQVY